MGVDRHRALSVAIPAAGFIAAAWFLAWPNHREASRLLHEAAVLERRTESFQGQTKALDTLKVRVAEAQARERQHTRLIPAQPEIAELMGTLSKAVPEDAIVDRTFNAGKSGPAVVGEAVPLEAMPLTIDMTSDFDSIFRTLQAAEAMSRLVRVSSLRLTRWMPEKDESADPLDSELITATIGLEAIYEAPPKTEAAVGTTKEKP
jgi:Tfp pilus assembly protein PilO